MHQVRRRFLSVDGRRVHYRQMGEGPPLVMLHGSPGDSEMLLPEMAKAAERFTCIGLDTPGFGLSDALPGDVLTVPDLARATAQAMSALALPACRVFGTHTGAAIGVELAVGWPERVSGLVVDGFPVFTAEEIARLFEGYFEPLTTDPLGGHLTSTWMRFRDQFIWFPWRSRDVTRRNPVDRPTPEEIDLWVSMYYRSCRTYVPAYRAACYYGQAGIAAAAALTTPAVFMASAEDMLFSHLDRLPPLRPDQRIERLPYAPEAKAAAIVDFAAALPGEAAADRPATNSRRANAVGQLPALQLVDTPDGQVFVRAYGDPTRPLVVMLHDAPGAGLALQEIALQLAHQFHVIAPDLPGAGESDAPAEGSMLDAGARAVSAIVDWCGQDRFALCGVGAGAAVALTFAQTADTRLAGLLLAEVPQPDAAASAAVAPPLELSPDGSHWLRAWLMIRDGEIYRPWFDGRVEAQRSDQGRFDADWLHDQTVALMRGRAAYHRLPREAHLMDTAAAISRATAPIHEAPLHAWAGALPSILT